MSSELVEAVRIAASHEAACAAVHELYARLGRLIGDRQPVCNASGECCRFDAYGHRLYVTTIELGAFVRDLAGRPIAASNPRALPQWTATDPGGCEFQVNGLCSVHPIRPFGCRIFFCDPTATTWQQDLYEQFHAELKRLHQEFSIPYAYVEWRMALQRVGATAGP